MERKPTKGICTIHVLVLRLMFKPLNDANATGWDIFPSRYIMMVNVFE